MSGRSTTRGQAPARPSERKEAIATNAARLFAQRGFAAVGMDDIGAAVGITGPAIYRHFAGKDAVLEAVIVALLERFVAGADAIDADLDAERDRSGPKGSDQLRALVAISVAEALDHPSEVATYVRERARLTPVSARRVATLERHLRGVWARVLRDESPAMTDEMVMLRQQMVLGAMASMTLRSGVSRPRLDQLLVAASVRVLRATVPGPSGQPGAPAAEWQPQVSRREAILNAALTLMRVKGYHGVGIDEIGDAAGISGPAVYRHYASKADILLDAYDRVGSRVAVGVEEALAGARGPADALGRLIDSYVRIAVDNVNLIIATGQEGAALPASEGPRLARQRRDIAESWSRVVVELRPDLSETEVRRQVASVFPMVNHVAQLPAGDLDRVPVVSALVAAYLVGDRS
jgi:AcrR family transcriptional regulator